jgi:hypothetical protein
LPEVALLPTQLCWVAQQEERLAAEPQWPEALHSQWERYSHSAGLAPGEPSVE